tara:strand:+ start:784 stop:1353 length:570 start_codon:yes stop_codon:yes gene_type:complete
MVFKKQLYVILSRLIGLVVLLLISLSVTADDIWIDVDTTKYTLSVMQGDIVQASFENIAIGRFGTTRVKMKNDDKTPLGRFRIGWINTKSRYYRFFGLDYPNREMANRALDEKRISEKTWLSIIQAEDVAKTPPQHTPMGGYIGIHGIGRGDEAVHNQFNWTNGCIALTNEQIDELGVWLRPGIMVEIH